MENIKRLEEMIEQVAAQNIKLNGGENVVVRSYVYTKKYLNSPYIVMDDIVWEHDQQDFLDTLRKLNIDKIIITNTSTALMSLIYFLTNEGCVIEGAVAVKENSPYGEDKKGLLMKIN